MPLARSSHTSIASEALSMHLLSGHSLLAVSLDPIMRTRRVAAPGTLSSPVQTVGETQPVARPRSASTWSHALSKSRPAAVRHVYSAGSDRSRPMSKLVLSTYLVSSGAPVRLFRLDSYSVGRIEICEEREHVPGIPAVIQISINRIGRLLKQILRGAREQVAGKKSFGRLHTEL